MNFRENLESSKRMKELPTHRSFRKWRNILLADCFIGYCLYYVTRKSCTYSIPMLLEDKSLSLTNEIIGVMASAQMLFYSIGKFICGILSDKYSSKLIFSVGMFFSGLCNILFALTTCHYRLIALWSINGFFQGCGWAPIAILVKRWYLSTEIGMIWSIISATMNVSSSMIPILMVTLSRTFDWRISFMIIGTVSCCFSFISYQLITDQPSDLNDDVTSISPSSRYSSDTTSSSKPTSKTQKGSGSNYLMIFSSRFLLLISVSYLLWTGIKNAVEDWLLVYLIDVKQLSNYQASFGIMAFQFGGLAASLTSGFISDIFMSKYQDSMKSSPRLPVVIFCSTFIVCWLFLLQLQFNTHALFINVTSFFLGLCSYGPHTLYGLLVIENSPPGLSGTAHGIAGTASTVGSIFSGYPVSYLSEHYGWNVVIVTFGVLSLVNSLLLLVCMRLDCRIGEKAKKED